VRPDGVPLPLPVVAGFFFFINCSCVSFSSLIVAEVFFLAQLWLGSFAVLIEVS
jgi:hypothetical protein